MFADPDHPCAETGHKCVGLYLYRCHRTGAVVLHFHGGTCDEPEQSDRVAFGPFDDWGDIRAQVLVALTDWWERCMAP